MYYSVVKRPAWVRALLAIWGLWFTTALSEAPGVHACPVHGGHAAHASAVEHVGHSASMGHGSHSSAPSDRSRHSPADCTCLGLCCCAPAVAAPAPSVQLVGEVFVSAPVARYGEVASPVIDRAYSHPFANGPPAL